MASPPGTIENARSLAARSFARSLNILLKYARLYGCDHTRTSEQFNAAWKELCAAQPPDRRTGVLLGVSGTQLLLDGIPLETAAAERSFAQILNSAGVASIHFSAATNEKDFSRFVRAFMNAGSKSSILSDELKKTLGESSTIRVNQVRFVAQSGDETEVSMLASQIAMTSLGEHASELRSWLSNPQKLLQMIAAAEGASSGIFTSGSGVFTPGSGIFSTASGQVATDDDSPAIYETPRETDIINVIHMLTRLGGDSSAPGQASNQTSDQSAKPTPADFQQQVMQLTHAGQQALQQALLNISEHPSAQPDAPLLVQLAENLAIKFAMDRYQRGEVKVNAVREMMERMSREMESLRKVLSAQEEKMARAGMVVETRADILDRQFWASMPEQGKRSVLLSSDAWCIPPRNIAQYVGELLERDAVNLPGKILVNYAKCVQSKEPEGRMKAALGLNHLAEYYGRSPTLLQEALQVVGDQLIQESVGDLQKALSATFVRLSQEATSNRQYTAIQQAIASVDELKEKFPALAERLRPRIGVLDRLDDFVGEAARAPQLSADLLEMLRCIPQTATEKLLRQFDHSVRRDQCERILFLIKQLGPHAIQHMKEKLKGDSPADAVLTVGVLSRLDTAALEEVLPRRVKTWSRFHQDMILRHIAAAGASERGRLLLKIMDEIDPVLLPILLDELGMSGDREASPRLMRIAFDDDTEGFDYLRIKAMEALGRLRETKASNRLCTMIESRKLMRWEYAHELRIAAAQALLMIDPLEGRSFAMGRGLTESDLSFGPLDAVNSCPWSRQRRYPRMMPTARLLGTVSTSRSQSKLQVNRISLGGGFGTTNTRVGNGTEANLELQVGVRKVRAAVLMREEQPRQMSFEIIGIDLKERGKLRKLLNGGPQSTAHMLMRHVTNLGQMRLAVLSDK
ncbi:MAG TPA: hypothetical protein VFA71_15500 [Terriglobales bacterium]|nr:hypothetical protein [Terriglobales bacterium]